LAEARSPRLWRGLLAVFALRLPSFISSCGLGGMRPRAAMRRFVASSCLDFVMPIDPKFTLQAPRPDMQLDACITFANASLETPKVKTAELEPIVSAFRYNVGRIRSMMLTPALIGHLTTEIQQLLFHIEFELTGRIGKVAPTVPDENAENISKRFLELYTAQQEEDAKLLGTPAWDKMVLERQMMGAQYVNILARSLHGSLGFEAMLAAYLTGTWTVFETLTGDLWETAVNAYPSRLAHLNGIANRLSKGRSLERDRTSSKRATDEIKSIPLNLVQAYRFDLRNKMGTLLREQRFEFSRLEDIRRAYALAFDEDSKEIDEALTDQAIDALRIVRNVIVHQGGIADANYVKLASAMNLPPAALRRQILLDGAKVVEMISPVISCASRLLGAVDEWLVKHKPKTVPPADGAEGK
jgi:hypothetical protein